MAYYEKRAVRDGVPVSIQCIMMHQNKPKIKDQLHYHDYTELLFGIEGESRVYLGDKTYVLGEGDMVIVHDHELHDVDGLGEPSSYIVIKFLPSILLTGEQTFSEYSYALTLMQNTDDRQVFFNREELLRTPVATLFQHAMAEWEGKRFGYELSLRADVTSIFLHILRKWHEKNMSAEEVNVWQAEIIEKAIRYIGSNYTSVSEEEVARSIGVSASYFSRTFKKNMKRSFTQYVCEVRLKEAERLLISTDASVAEISAKVGFSTSAYFISIFKKNRGATPAQYRRNNRKM